MALSATLPAQTAAGSTSVTVAGIYQLENYKSDTVQQVTVLPPVGYTTVTGVATNNFTINVRQLRAATVVQTFATLTAVSGVNFVAETPVSIPITVQPLLHAGDVIDVQLVQNASGLALGSGLIVAVTVD